MAKITNNERAVIILPTGQIVPRLGTLEIDNATIRQPDNWPSLSGRALAGQITIEFDPEPNPADPEVITTQVVTPPEPNAVLALTDAKPADLHTTKGKSK